MARKSRIYSTTEFYHIYNRGNNKELIFKDTIDYQVFKMLLRKLKDALNITIIAYCLMPNHYHLAIKADNTALSPFLQRLTASYTRWFNKKYNRTGSLYEGRFKSKPIENDLYFLTVIRYIHQNPIKASLCNTLLDYTQSSYHEYINQSKWNIVNTSYILNIMNLAKFKTSNESFLTSQELSLLGDLLGVW